MLFIYTVFICKNIANNAKNNNYNVISLRHVNLESSKKQNNLTCIGYNRIIELKTLIRNQQYINISIFKMNVVINNTESIIISRRLVLSSHQTELYICFAFVN